MSEPLREPKGARLAIGALSRATGIPVETLRTWETRYGFPVPDRRPSGHRVYALSTIPRLKRIAEALARGHRARQVVSASDADLKLLLAYGTISQLGFMVAVFGWGTPAAMVAGCLMLLAHGAFKASGFMVVGIIDHQYGTRDVRRLPAPTAGGCPRPARSCLRTPRPAECRPG